MEIRIEAYHPEWKDRWDEAARKARQASFLFERDFMDYHGDRFADASVMVLNRQGRIVALFPACRSPKCAGLVESHGGLTYGGLLLLPEATTVLVERMFEALAGHYRELGYRKLLYKPVPHIYHTYPAEEDIYWLFRQGATLCSRAVSTAIDLRCAYPLSQLRKRKVHKADRRDDLQCHTQTDRLPDFWHLLDRVLTERHATHPVHTLEELELLCSRFPERIRLLTVTGKASRENGLLTGEAPVLAGCLLFVTPRVIHVQYIAAS